MKPDKGALYESLASFQNTYKSISHEDYMVSLATGKNIAYFQLNFVSILLYRNYSLNCSNLKAKAREEIFQKFLVDHSVKQCIVHFHNLENIEEYVVYLKPR